MSHYQYCIGFRCCLENKYEYYYCTGFPKNMCFSKIMVLLLRQYLYHDYWTALILICTHTLCSITIGSKYLYYLFCHHVLLVRVPGENTNTVIVYTLEAPVFVRIGAHMKLPVLVLTFHSSTVQYHNFSLAVLLLCLFHY